MEFYTGLSVIVCLSFAYLAGLVHLVRWIDRRHRARQRREIELEQQRRSDALAAEMRHELIDTEPGPLGPEHDASGR